MRSLSMTMLTVWLATTTIGLAEEAGSPRTVRSFGKPVTVTKEFCDACGCCHTQPIDFLEQTSAQTAPPAPVMKKSIISAFKQLQSSSNVSPNALKDIAAATTTRALVDICNACRCCIEHDDTITIGPTTVKAGFEDFHVFKK